MKNLGKLPTNKKILAMAMAVAIVLAAAIPVVLLPGYVQKTNQRHISGIVDELASGQAQILGKNIQQLQAALQAKVQSAETLQALQQGDTAQLQMIAERIRTSIPGTIQLQFIPATTDYNTLNLRFSQLDRLHKAEHNETVYPEGFDENGNKFIDFIITAKDGENRIAGYLLAILDGQLLQRDLEKVPTTTGETLLQQKFDRAKAQTIFRLGGGNALEQASSPAETPVPYWKVVVVPGTTLATETVIAPLLMFAIQGVIIALGCAGLFFTRRYANSDSKHVETNHITPIQIKGARKINKGDVTGSNGLELPEEELADPLFQSGDVFDLDDDAFLDIRPAEVKPAVKPLEKQAVEVSIKVPATIFRDYDIRGNADRDITDELARHIGMAFGSECREQGHDTVVLAGDGRLSTPRIKTAVQDGLQASGCNVIDISCVPTPLLYFATHTLPHARCGIMVTASHNPGADNGFKMVIDGHTLASEQIQRLRERIESGDYTAGAGEYSEQDILESYIDHITSDIVLAGSYKVVVDCGNGIAGTVAPRLLEELGCDVIPLYCDVDGTFPNHAPDPSVMENLNALIEKVREENADLGIALDGDGDRLGVVTASGNIILPDMLLMLFAKDIVSRNPGADIIFDVKCTRRLNTLISSHGGRPVMWKSGHSHIKNKMIETGAPLGGELSGHIFFKERWFGFDDGTYSAARLLEIMSIRDQDIDTIFNSFPKAASTPEILIPVPEESKFALISRLAETGEWGNGKVTTIDGVRVDFVKGWGLVRASNTSAALTLRFEADDEDTLVTVEHVFKHQLELLDKNLKLPF